MKLTITVTKEILEKSAMCGKGLYWLDPINENCAIALAVRDIFPNAKVYTKGLDLFGETKTFHLDNPKTIPLPKSAINFISSFDSISPASRILMQPISFDIDLPDWVIERIDISELKPLLENHPTLKLQTEPEPCTTNG